MLQYGEIILQKPEEETQGQTIVFTSISQIMEFVLTSKCVGVSGRFAYGSFCIRSVRLRIESIRLRLICQFAYESDVEALKLNY